MRINETALDEFIEVYKEEFGESIDRQQATEMARRVLLLYDLLTRRLPNEKPLTPMQPTDDSPSIGFRT